MRQDRLGLDEKVDEKVDALKRRLFAIDRESGSVIRSPAIPAA